MKKSDIDIYRDRRGASLPSINVKVNDAYRWYTHGREAALNAGADESEAGRFATWCETNADDEGLAWLFDAACESGWETAEIDAEEVFGIDVKVEARGRSGGHLVVLGLPDVEEWDAIAVARWSRFARYADGTAKGIPFVMAELAYLNEWDQLEREREERETECAASALPIVAVV